MHSIQIENIQIKKMLLRQRGYNWTNCVLQTSSVKQIHCAYDETFVILMGDIQINHHMLHVDRNCIVLRMESLNNTASITMISESEVVVGEETRIWLIDLKNKHNDRNIRITDFPSRESNWIGFDSTYKSFFFEETKQFCLIQLGRTTIKNIQVKAVFLPLSSIYQETTNGKIVQKLKAKYPTQVLKVDNYSSIATIHQHGLAPGDFKIISKDKIRSFSDKNKILHDVTNMWRKSQDQFYVQSSRRPRGQKEKDKMDQGIFIVDIARENFEYQALVPKEEQILSITFLNKCFFLKVKGSRYFLKMFDYDLKLQKVCKSKQSDEYSVCSYDGTMLMSVMKYKTKNLIQLKKSKIFELKDVYMQMLLHENEDFDDDLLLDSLNVLGFE